MRRSGKYAPRSKFVSGISISENDLTSQDRKFSAKPSCAFSPGFNITSNLAIDDSNRNSNSNTNIHSSVPVLGAGT